MADRLQVRTEITDRELRIVRLLLAYKGYAQIAEQLHMSERAAKWYMEGLYVKLGFREQGLSQTDYRVALLRWALKNKIVEE